MSYRVVYAEQFHEALDAQLEYLVKQGAPQTRVAAWLTELLDLVDGLEEFPRRWPVAEPESAARRAEIRKITFGDYLVFYRADDQERVVLILGMRHGARLR